MRKALSDEEWLRLKPHKPLTPKDEENLEIMNRAFQAGYKIIIETPNTDMEIMKDDDEKKN
jgi:hypothetical protein